jgi:TonB family protein
MRHTLFVTIATACLTTALAEPSNYFYRISPADAPLKEAPALYAPRPDYPIQSRQRHLTGSGLFALHITPDGNVERVEVLKSIGYPILDQAAIAAFRQWRFRPRSISLVRVPIRYSIGPFPHDAISRHIPRDYGDGVQVDVCWTPH